MKLISWNVNGLRACLGKGFGDYFAAQLQGIFSCPAGDIIHAVIKSAVSKKQKEGFLWKSIPLRA